MPFIGGGGVEKNLYIISNHLSKKFKKILICTHSLKQRKKFNKRYRATVSPLFYDVVVGGDDDQDNSNNDNNGSSGNVKNKTAVQVWDTSGKSSFSRLGLIFEEFRLVDLFLLTFSI